MNHKRKGGNRARLFVPQTLLQSGIANPDSGRITGRIADEPRIGKIVDGSRLAANHPPGKFLIPHHGSRGAAGYHAPHHLLHLRSNKRSDYLERFGFPSSTDTSLRVSDLSDQMRFYA